jgi:hypothetical protein
VNTALSVTVALVLMLMLAIIALTSRLGPCEVVLAASMICP